MTSEIEPTGSGGIVEGGQGFIENPYEFLQGLKSKVFLDPQRETAVSITSEDVCEATGGSCMDVFIRKRNGENEHAHISQKNEVEAYFHFDHEKGALIVRSKALQITDPRIQAMIKAIRDIASNPESSMVINHTFTNNPHSLFNL